MAKVVFCTKRLLCTNNVCMIINLRKGITWAWFITVDIMRLINRYFYLDAIYVLHASTQGIRRLWINVTEVRRWD